MALPMTATHTIVDLFAGAGGMTAGFVAAGFQPVFAVEIDPDAAATYRANFGAHVAVRPIESVLNHEFPEAEVVIGGPPCQGFSPLGRMNGDGSNSALNGLWREYARALEIIKPSVFVLENVPQLLRSAEFRILVRFFEGLGYRVDAAILNAVEFDVPQKRRRAFVVGSRVGRLRLPSPSSSPARSVEDAIGHLSTPLGRGESLRRGEHASGHELHFRRNPWPISLERYRLIPPGGNRFDLMSRAPELTPSCWLNKPTGSTDVFGRLVWTEPALTIRTEFFKPEKGRYLHPDQDRAITHLEAALLQTFPENYVWSGTKLSIARQIGNAVPVRLAEAVARAVRSMLRNPALTAS